MSDDLAPVEWDELSNGELRQRLVNRGVEHELASIMVDDRECCDGCRRLISDALN